MASKRPYRWLIEPLDERSNRIASEIPGVTPVEDVKRSNEKPANMWKLPSHKELAKFCSTADNSGGKYQIYVQEVSEFKELPARRWKLRRRKLVNPELRAKLLRQRRAAGVH